MTAKALIHFGPGRLTRVIIWVMILVVGANRQHSPLLLWIQNDPAYDFLHSDERYRSIIRGIGLPPAY
jgi:hypothetical protein